MAAGAFLPFDVMNHMSHMSKKWRRIEILGIPVKLFNFLSPNINCIWHGLFHEWINNYLIVANFRIH